MREARKAAALDRSTSLTRGRARVFNRAAFRQATAIMANGGTGNAAAASPFAMAKALVAVGEVVELSLAALRQGVRTRRDLSLVVEQLDQVGVRSLSIVNLTALFMGMVLALQMGNFLAKFGAQIFS